MTVPEDTRRRTSRVESTVEFIQGMIAARHLEAGDQLPTIKELSEEAGLSQSTIREGMQKLAAVGRLRIEHGVGTFVAKPSLKGILQPLLDSDVSGLVENSDLFEVRRELAAITLKLAVERSAKEVGRLLRSTLDTLSRDARTLSSAELLELDSTFQDRLARLTSNALLRTLVLAMRNVGRRPGGEGAFEPDVVKYVTVLELVLEALGAGETQRAADTFATLIEALMPSEERRNLVVYCDALGTGSTGGSFFTLGQRISAILARTTGVYSTVQLTGGGLENVRLTEAAKIGLGIAQIDVAVDAFNGHGDFDKPHTNIRSIAPLGGLELHIFTLAAGPVTSLRDLNGKTVGLGAFGGASEKVASEVLQRFGYVESGAYIAKQAPFDEMITMLVDGELDLVFFLSSSRNSALIEFAIARELRFLSIDPPVLRELVKDHPYWQANRIEAFSYPHQDVPISTLRVPMTLITHSAVSEADVYSITRVLHAENVLLNPESAPGLDGLPQHPGAARYWRDRR